MKISRVTIQNYRGIKSLSIDLDETTVIFGSNNAGKSTILAAIQTALGRSATRRSSVFDEYDFHLANAGQPTEAEPIVIEVTFAEIAGENWPDDKIQQLGPVVGIGPDGLQMVTLRVTGRYDEALNVFASQFDFLNPQGEALPKNSNVVRRLQQIIPAFYLAALRDAGREFRSNAQFWAPFVGALKIDPDVRTQIENELAQLNQQVLDAHDGFASVKSRLSQSSQLVPLGGGENPVNIEALPNRVFDILARTQVMLAGVSGASLPLSQHGEGTQSLAVICLFDAFLESQLVGEYGENSVPILTLEEPEAHLHPSAVRAVGKLLASLSGQKIITTHSGDLLASVPLRSLRRIRRNGDEIDVFRISDGAIDAADLRRLDHHIRRLRGGILFARVWILVEGETDETIIQEVARIQGHDIFADGICCFKFTELGVEPYIRLADAFGIHWIVVADNDAAGQAYTASAQALLGGRDQAKHIVALPAWDIETYLCIQGYGTVYQTFISPQKAAANPNPHAQGTDAFWQHLVNKQIPSKGKPARVIEVVDEIEARGPPGVPQFFKDLLTLATTHANETT